MAELLTCPARVALVGAVLGLDRGRPQLAIFHVAQRHRHRLGRAVDRDMPEELQAETRGEIAALLAAAAHLVHDLRAERMVEVRGPAGAGMNRARDEFPER